MPTINYLDKNGLSYFWNKIDAKKQDKLTAGSNITFSGSTINATVPTKTSDLTNDGADGTSTYVEATDLATVATSGSYNDLTDKPADFELVEMSYGESNAWAKFIDAYRGHKIVYCRASSNSNPATGAQGRKAFMAYVNNAENPTEVEFQYVRSVSSKTASQPVDQVYVYKLTSSNGGTWTVTIRNMGPKLAQGTNTTVSYSNGTYTVSASQPTVNDATLTIQKNGTTVKTFTANASSNVTANITVPTKTSDLTNDSGFLDSVAWEDVTGKPTFATVATSGSYNDLTNKPTIPAAVTVDSALSSTSTNPVQNKVINTALNRKQASLSTAQLNAANSGITAAKVTIYDGYASQIAAKADISALDDKQDALTAGDHINITNDTISATGYVHSDDPVTTTSSTATVTGSMIANGTITADKLATGATLKLTLSTTDIGEGAALAANTLYGVYQ